jgi:hypothetical protein
METVRRASSGLSWASGPDTFAARECCGTRRYRRCCPKATEDRLPLPHPVSLVRNLASRFAHWFSRGGASRRDAFTLAP